MGDRGVILITDGDYYSPGIYVHWNGYQLLELLEAAIPSMRSGDVGYSAARLCGVLHNEIDGNTGLGLVSSPSDEDLREDFFDYSPGDAGVLVYDCTTGACTAYAGYLADAAEDEENEIVETPHKLDQGWPKKLPIPPP